MTKADKGVAVVTLKIKLYIHEAIRQVNNTNNYEHLYFDSTKLHSEKKSA